MKDIHGKTAVITGAAHGIGEALARSLAREGCRLALVDVNEAGLTRVGDEVEALGAKVSKHVVDVSNRTRMEELVGEISEAHGAIHMLINNAGVSVNGSFVDQTIEDFERVLGVNLWGVIYGCKFFLPVLWKAEEAHIVNISSIFGVVGLPGQSSYCSSKFAIRGLTETLWEELRGSHVHVTVVHPGGVATNLVSASKHYDQETKQKIIDMYAEGMMTANSAADEIVVAIKANRRRVLITNQARFIDYLKRLVPEWGNQLVAFGALRRFGGGHLRARLHAEWDRRYR